MTDATETARFALDAAPLAKALDAIAAVIARRNTVPILANVLIEAREERLCLTGTDLDARLTIALACTVEAPGIFTLPVYALADAVKAAAKVKGARVEINAGTETAELLSGRSRMRFPVTAAVDFPLMEYADASETWEAPAADVAALDCRAEGLELAKETGKALKKLAKRAGADDVATVRRYEPEGRQARLRIEAADYDYSAGIYSPMLCGLRAPKRERFTFRTDPTLKGEARAYLNALRESHGLPLIKSAKDYGAEYPAELVTREGLPIGLTVGACWNDYAEVREMPADWAPGADYTLSDSGFEATAPDGAYYWNRQRDGDCFEPAWLHEYRPERPGALVYAEGAYSLPMPIERRQPLTGLTVEVDGVLMPLAADWKDDTSREIALSAEQVAAMCGPVDPSTFVKIPAAAFHHGRIIATGAAASCFLAMQRGHEKRLKKLAKDRTPDGLAAYAAECAAFAPIIAACAEGRNVTEEEGRAAGIDETSARVLGNFADKPEPDVEPIEEEAPAVLAAIDAYLAPDVAADDADAWEAVTTALDDEASADPEPAADYANPMQEPAAAPIERTPADMESRLARLEAALGLVQHAKRTPAHAAAIRRAWSMRRKHREALTNMRRAREDDALRWQETERARLSALRDLQGMGGRLERAEAFAVERVELVAEIDRLRADGNDRARELAAMLKALESRKRVSRRAVAMRREIERTRAERDGIAANLQAMTRRCTEDAAVIERMGGDVSRPRIILSAR